MCKTIIVLVMYLQDANNISHYLSVFCTKVNTLLGSNESVGDKIRQALLQPREVDFLSAKPSFGF